MSAVFMLDGGCWGTPVKDRERAPSNERALASKYELHLLYFTALTLAGSNPFTEI